MEEIWKPIPGFKGMYEASNLGRIRNVERIIIDKRGRDHPIKGCVRKLHTTPTCPYYVIVLSKGRREFHNYLVHRLIASTFLKDYTPELEINHIDGNKHNNRVDNLEMATRLENITHARKTGLANDVGTNNSRSVLSEALVRKGKVYRKWGLNVSGLAREYGVKPATLLLAVQGKTYKNIK